jgi:RHS repeat-associated protein
VVAGNLSGGPVSLDPIFPQGSSSEAGSTASIYLPPVGSDDLYASLPPRSKDLWADGTIQVVFDLAEARIQILTYASGEGWVQDGDDIPAEFVEGDRYRVSMDESGMLEISRNGEVVTTREMAPKTSLQQPGGFKLASYPLNVLAAPKTSTPTRTPTATLTPSQTATLTNTATATVTNTPIDTATFTLTVPPTETMTEIPTGIPTFTSTPVLPTATLPPVPSGPLTIDYIYDALNRLTSATYSDGRSFGYTYDEAGNVLELEKNLGPGTVVTTYTYDTANQLDTATENGVTWQYHYDANGSLIETLPDGAAGSGAKRYTYNVAGYLTQVELHNGSDWQTQTEMDYNGLGQRLSMDAAGVIAHYVMDGNQPLTATAGTNTSFYLYGLGPIGEKTDAWSYSLPDGTNTPRQISNITADITLSARYTPWGDTLDTYGNGSFAFGYFGGVLDAATGLLYVGNGQYYDPETGRFLTRDAKPNNTNPYIPWDPTGAIIGPLGIAALFFTRRKKGSKVGTFLVLLLVLGSVGMTLAACSNVPAGRVTVTATLTPGAPVNYTATVDNGFTVTGTLPASSGAAIGIATSCATIPPTPSPTPTSTPTPPPDQLNESLLHHSPLTRTNVSGADYYKWYKELWDDKDWWWWLEGNTTFTVWDFITLILYVELDYMNSITHAGYPAYRQAAVRAAYQWCKEKSPAYAGTPEGALNWIAGYSESGSKRFFGSRKIDRTPYTMEGARLLTNSLRSPEANGASEWTEGLRANQPYGVGNKSLYEEDPKKQEALDKAASLGMIFWRSGKDTGNEVIIPTGCGSYLLSLDRVNYKRLECGNKGEWPLKD